jgi:hypothetical protein
MVERPVHRFKVVLVCLGLGCLAIPAYAALGNIPACMAVGSDEGGLDAAARRAVCPAEGDGMSYDSRGVRCVQGGSGCDLHAL